MISATHRWATLLLLALLASPLALAQDELGDDFILFVDGTNVLIPAVAGGETVADPQDADNRVVRFSPGNWVEGGFEWDREMGVDATANVGASYGESDTLYFRMLSDPANQPLAGISILISVRVMPEPLQRCRTTRCASCGPSPRSCMTGRGTISPSRSRPLRLRRSRWPATTASSCSSSMARP